MNFKIGTICYALSPTLILASHIISPIENSVRDFKKLTDLAKKWAEHTYHEWFWKKLSGKELSALNEYTQFDYKNINRYLKDVEGKLVPETDELAKKYNIKHLNEKIQTIDSALEKVKISEAMHLYKRIDERHFGFQLDELRSEKGDVNQKLFKKINDDFINKRFKQYNFVSTSLVNEPQHETFNYVAFPILIKLKIPQGTHVGYLGEISRYSNELEMLIKRNYTFKYEKFYIIQEFNKETIKVEVSLVEK